MVNSKYAFWQALIFTVVVFGLGLVLGFFLEGFRANSVEVNLMHSEVDLLDAQIRNRVSEDFDIDCNIEKEKTFEFADKIYSDVFKLEEYDTSSKFTDTLKIVHSRYDLLRMMLWTEAIRNKKICDSDFHTVVYFFNYTTDNIEIKARQATFSRLLFDLKQKSAGKVLLIPIAVDLKLSSVDTVLQSYNINSIPAVLIDENKVVENIPTYDELEKDVFEIR